MEVTTYIFGVPQRMEWRVGSFCCSTFVINVSVRVDSVTIYSCVLGVICSICVELMDVIKSLFIIMCLFNALYKIQLGRTYSHHNLLRINRVRKLCFLEDADRKKSI